MSKTLATVISLALHACALALHSKACVGVATRHVSLSMWHVTIPKYRTFLDWSPLLVLHLAVTMVTADPRLYARQ